MDRDRERHRSESAESMGRKSMKTDQVSDQVSLNNFETRLNLEETCLPISPESGLYRSGSESSPSPSSPICRHYTQPPIYHPHHLHHHRHHYHSCLYQQKRSDSLPDSKESKSDSTSSSVHSCSVTRRDESNTELPQNLTRQLKGNLTRTQYSINNNNNTKSISHCTVREPLTSNVENPSTSSTSSEITATVNSPGRGRRVRRPFLYRSLSDPQMASSAYSPHTSALLLTTGAYQGSPNLLSSSPSPSPSPSPHLSSRLSLSPCPPTSTAHSLLGRRSSSSPKPTTSTTTTTTTTLSSGASSASQFFSSQMSYTKRCVLRLDGYSYLIVANPPENKVTKDALGSSRPSETIVIRRGPQKTSSDQWTVNKQERQTTMDSSNLKDPNIDSLPPVDTVEACDKAASRLRELAQHLDHGEVPISILKKTLQYAACVLDTVTMDETRKRRSGMVKKPGFGVNTPSDPLTLHKSLSIGPGSPLTSKFNAKEMSSNLRRMTIKTVPPSSITRKILDEEDDLSEVQPDAVPSEVREWLASTFTRNNTAQKRRSEEKLKFRSVANAIRAGIMVDRLYRRLCCSNMVQIPPKIADKLKSIDNWSYDCFKLNEASNHQVLKYLSYELLNRYGLVHKFKIPLETLESCLNQFEQGYTKYKNPYHNNIHAADVTQTVHYMLSRMGLVNWLTDIEIFATLLAAIIHDFQHTGTTNNFHVMSGSDTALLYNDRAVLENFHVSAAFRVLRESDCNILVNLNKEEYRELRTLVIDMVLATDMSSHFQQIKTMKSLLSNPNEFTVDKSKALSMVLHCCDISHPSKQWDIHKRWTELLLEEFFRQGDKEKELGLPYSPLCDRNTTLVAESQIGFIDFIVGPSLEVCGDLLDKIYQQLEGCRNSSGSSEESLEVEMSENKSRPKSLSTYKNKKGALSIDSADSAINSRPVASAPASPRFSHSSSFINCKIEGNQLKRPWAENLDENRKRWQERAAIDALQREQRNRKPTADGISLSMSPESEL